MLHFVKLFSNLLPYGSRYLSFPHNRFIDYLRISTLSAFHVPIILSVHISLGFLYNPVSTTSRIFDVRSFINTNFTQPLKPSLSDKLHFYNHIFRAVHSRIRQPFYGHSHHRYFIDVRSITTRPPLVRISSHICVGMALNRLYRAYDNKFLNYLMPFGVSTLALRVRYFPHLTIQIISSTRLITPSG